MNKTLILSVLAVLLVGGGVYYFTQAKTSSEQPLISSSTQDGTHENLTLKELLGLGRNLRCTFSGDGMTNGTVYVAGNRVRGEFEVEGQEANMISDGEWLYYWGSALPQGIKMKADAEVTTEVQTGNASTASSVSNSFDAETAYDYACGTWGVDASKFTLPSGVEFLDVSAQTELMLQQMQQNTGTSCSACDYLSGEAATMCRQSLGC